MTRLRRPVDLANVVKDRRAQLGLTQAQLAEAALVSRQWVSGFESGKNTGSVKFTDLAAVLDALDIDLDAKPRGQRARDPQCVPGRQAGRYVHSVTARAAASADDCTPS